MYCDVSLFCNQYQKFSGHINLCVSPNDDKHKSSHLIELSRRACFAFWIKLKNVVSPDHPLSGIEDITKLVSEFRSTVIRNREHGVVKEDSGYIAIFNPLICRSCFSAVFTGEQMYTAVTVDSKGAPMQTGPDARIIPARKVGISRSHADYTARIDPAATAYYRPSPARPPAPPLKKLPSKKLPPPLKRVPAKRIDLCPICGCDISHLKDFQLNNLRQNWTKKYPRQNYSKLDVFVKIYNHLGRRGDVSIPRPSGRPNWKRDFGDYHRVLEPKKKSDPKDKPKDHISILAYWEQCIGNIVRPEQVFICHACSKRYHRNPNRVEIYAALQELRDWEIGK